MKTRVSMKLVLLGLLVAFSFAVVPVAGAQPGEFVKGVLQPLADGFPKRAINIIVVDDPGSRDDLYAKSLQAALKGVSPVNVTVSDEPAAVGGTWYTVQEVAKREGGSEGYYPIVVDSFGVPTDLHVEPGTKTIGAKLDQLNMVISTELFPFIWYQKKNAPWGPTFAGMVKYGKANPGKLRYISKEVGTGPDITAEWVMYAVGGLKVEKIPQGTSQEVASTVGSGQGDFAVTNLTTVLPNWQAGRIDVTLVMSETVPDIWKNDPNVVSSKQAGLNIYTGIIEGLGVPSQVPQAHVDWLYKLFKAAATSDVHQSRAKTIPGMQFRIIDGAAANAENRKIYEDIEPVIRAIGLHVDDIKK